MSTHTYMEPWQVCASQQDRCRIELDNAKDHDVGIQSFSRFVSKCSTHKQSKLPDHEIYRQIRVDCVHICELIEYMKENFSDVQWGAYWDINRVLHVDIAGPINASKDSIKSGVAFRIQTNEALKEVLEGKSTVGVARIVVD